MLIGREVGLRSDEGGAVRWSVDHLFLDQDAVPTVVEVKRSSDTRIRREVIGHLIEYAANGVKYWPIDRIRAQFEAQCAANGVDGAERLREVLGSIEDIQAFWLSAKQNLEAGRVRMVFVGDCGPLVNGRVGREKSIRWTRTDINQDEDDAERDHRGDFCRPGQAIVRLPVVGPADRIQASGLDGGGQQASGGGRVLVDKTVEPLLTHDRGGR